MSDRPPDPVRRAAFKILLRAEERPRSLDTPLRMAAATFDDRNRRFLWSLVQESSRWKSRLDSVIAPLVSRPMERLDAEVRVILRLVAVQLCLLDSVPAHAAVDEAVRLARAEGTPGSDRLVNAVSRRLAADGRARWGELDGREDPKTWPVRFSHPAWLVERWRARWGDPVARAALEWDNSRPPIWVRGRPGEEAPPGAPGWVPGTFRMAEEYRPAADPVFAEGGWTVQDPSETLVGLLPPMTRSGPILDLCAAPGTKTSHLAERHEGKIIAMDRTRRRVRRLIETLRRTRGDCAVVVGDLLRPPFRPALAAGALVDAPCSNLGVLRRRPDARWNVSEGDLSAHGRRQGELLRAAAALVRPGGWLLYSVCSTEPEETVEVCEAFLASGARFRPIPFALPLRGDIVPRPGSLLIRPGQEECDGVYALLLERIGG